MNFGTAVRTCLANYATFAGRARRSEYWYFVLFNVILTIVAAILDSAVFGRVFQSNSGPLQAIVAIGLFLPGLAVSVRRLHDLDRSGWWVLLSGIPLIGFIVLLVWFCRRGTLGPNRFGGDPLADGADAFAPSALPGR